ncbi:S1 RNA-binding domain-containing protein [Virgibacillus soli]|uniref:S1-like domain-containing RNA-binding protein n=1 Tax=Paracerasibacillus soli TaxID=480284 RepID=A0ABU5CT27_9BACI|nr:S1-like domain-containing RNA-binding protein [Virgibacillus soli]MDY0408974.1 S1-like domain-containing RNA-binding protein [Virgibacillus soli]
MIEAGLIYPMKVNRKIDTGYVLEKDSQEVLLHHNEVTVELNVDEEVTVFVYQDKKGNLCGTTVLPKATKNTYGWATVQKVIPNLGVFVSFETTTEVLVSKDTLPLYEHVWPQEEDHLYITLTTDKRNRLLGVPATEGVIEQIREWAPNDYLNQHVKGWVYHTSREGSAIITDEDYRGFVHHTERKDEPRLGEQIDGRVIDVKEDGTINISLRPLKQHSMLEDADIILEHLQNHGGKIPFTDRSDPEEIRATFQISKSAFKRALGKLMKEGKVKQQDGMTHLVLKDME